jgi:hypothetical protein
MNSEGLVQIRRMHGFEREFFFERTQLTSKGIDLICANCDLELSRCIGPAVDVAAGVNIAGD